MEIVNSKTIKSFVWIISIITFAFTALPIILYFINFHGKLSDSQANWGAFGDYFGGIIGTLFNLIAVIFSIISIYITLKIATRIHENEQKFNIENHKREIEKFNKEIELVQKQNKPYPFLHIIRYKDKIEVEIFNQGTGPLIVKKWKIVYKVEDNEHEYRDFGSFLKEKTDFSKYKFDTITFRFNNVNNFVLAPGSSKRLLQIIPIGERTDLFNQFSKETLSLFSKSKFIADYEDIFENKNTYYYKL